MKFSGQSHQRLKKGQLEVEMIFHKVHIGTVNQLPAHTNTMYKTINISRNCQKLWKNGQKLLESNGEEKL